MRLLRPSVRPKVAPFRWVGQVLGLKTKFIELDSDSGYQIPFNALLAKNNNRDVIAAARSPLGSRAAGKVPGRQTGTR